MKLQYDLAVTGHQNVKAALASVERRFAQHNQRIMGQSGVRPGRRSPSTKSVAQQGMMEARRVQRMQMGMQRFQHKQALANIKAEEREKIASERRVDRLRRNRARARLRRIRAMHREQRERSRSLERFRERTVGRARGFGGLVGGSVGGTLRGVAGGAVAALGLGGGMITAQAVRERASAEKAAAVLANKAVGTSGDPRNRAQLQNSILSQARSEGIRTGLGTEGAIEALRQFHGISGRMKEGQALLPFMGDLADAYGADIGDVGRTGGQIMQAMAARGITGDDAVAQTQNILASMAGQAKVGSIEFADLATQMGKLISATARFNGPVDELASTMGAVSQLAIAGAASSPEEAMTAILRFSDDVITNFKKFEGQGISVFSDKERTKLRAPEEIIFDVLKQTGGDLTKIKPMFGIRAQKAVAPFQTLFTEKGGGEAGLQAVRALLDSAKGGMTTAEVRESAQATRETSGKQFDIQMAKVRDMLGEKFLPVLVRLIPEFEKLIPVLTMAANLFTRFVSALAENPAGTIGKMIAAKLVMDIGMAGIGKAVNAALVGAVNRMTGGTSMGVPGVAAGSTAGVARAPGVAAAPSRGPMGKPGAGASLAAAGMGAAVGFTIASAIITAGVVSFEASEANMEISGAALNRAREAAERGDKATVNQILREEQDRLGKVQKPGMFESMVQAGLGLTPLGMLGGEETNRSLSKDIAGGMGLRSDVEEQTLSNNVDELFKLLSEAAKKQMEAANSQKDAASKLAAAGGGGGTNRGNAPGTPSPI